jgi:hypothetical protein
MRAALLLCLALSGCASDCGPDWYEVGMRDGRINAGSQVERYAGRCGARPDETRYAEGYSAGFAQRPIPNW